MATTAKSASAKTLRRDRGTVPLDRALSKLGLSSRKAARALIIDGRVTVDDRIVTNPSIRIVPERARISIDGTARTRSRALTIVLHKPRGYVTTRSDPQRRPTVIDLVQDVKEYVYPVGRLDYDTEGLLLLTNDGDLAARLTHPSHEVPRVYEARVLGIPDDHDLQRLSRGLVIEGRRTAAADVHMKPPRRDDEQATLVITLREGRNRQVRDMCDAIGHPVEHLRRVAIGPLRDSRLKAGHWRDLTPEEVARLKRVATASPPRRRG